MGPMPSVRLGKTGFRFNALHSFPADAGYDRHPHGHDYELAVMLEGDLPPSGILYNMSALKPLVEREVIARLDHTDLDVLLPQASLERLAEWIWLRLRPQIPAELRLGLTLWETRSIYIEFWGT
jgi:6-pyruvoyltetrahydropterin/6-carboxytetrahydropterin synthase